jgi:hypothetical protein
MFDSTNSSTQKSRILWLTIANFSKNLDPNLEMQYFRVWVGAGGGVGEREGSDVKSEDYLFMDDLFVRRVKGAVSPD